MVPKSCTAPPFGWRKFIPLFIRRVFNHPKGGWPWDFGTKQPDINRCLCPSSFNYPSSFNKGTDSIPKIRKRRMEIGVENISVRSQKKMHQQNRKALESTALSVSLYLFPNLETLHVNRPFKKMAVPQRLSFIDRWYIHTFNPGIRFFFWSPYLHFRKKSSSNLLWSSFRSRWSNPNHKNTNQSKSQKVNIWRKSTTWNLKLEIPQHRRSHCPRFEVGEIPFLCETLFL